MQPEFTEEQLELKSSVEKFWRDEITPERLQAWEKEPSGVDEVAWKAMAGLGWIGLGVPAEHGGSGLGLVEVACLVEECARGLVPRRLIEAIRGAVALTDVAADSVELADVAAGMRRVTIARDERAARKPESMQTACREGKVSGEKWCVPDPSADWHIVVAVGPNGPLSVLVAGAEGKLDGLATFDGSEQAAVTYDGAEVVRVLGEGAEAVARMDRVQQALALAEMVGGMKAALDATVAYVQEREQFGQKIGVFQAVQHQVADMALAHTASRHLAWRAICRLANGTEEGLELESAAAFVARSFKDITMTAHHLHGGAGYVVEHPLHYHSERAQALAIRYTPESDALEAVAGALLD